MTPYFAYGSNMNQNDLDAYCKKHNRQRIVLSAKNPQPCILKDYALVFDYESKTRKGGAADIEERPGGHVEGVLFEMNDEDMKTISMKECAPSCYEQKEVRVTMRGDTVKNAVTYVVCKNQKAGHFVPPRRAYLQIVIDGAKAFGLSEEWIKKLEAIPTAD